VIETVAAVSILCLRFCPLFLLASRIARRMFLHKNKMVADTSVTWNLLAIIDKKFLMVSYLQHNDHHEVEFLPTSKEQFLLLQTLVQVSSWANVAGSCLDP
jgi:hypothetical protein